MNETNRHYEEKDVKDEVTFRLNMLRELQRIGDMLADLALNLYQMRWEKK